MFAPTRIRKFRATQLAELRTALVELSRHTQQEEVTESLLRLRPDGTTAAGFRYTQAGFASLATLLAPGLAALLPALAGTYRRPGQSAEVCSVSTAVSVFNAVLALRMPLLHRHNLLAHTRERRIDGITGPGWYYAPGLVLLQLLEEQVAAQSDLRFCGAELVGRRAAIWYRKPAFRVTVRRGPESFWPGYCVINGETDGALRGTLAVLYRSGCLLGSFGRDSCVHHLGERFESRAGQLFARVLQREHPAELPERLAGLEQQLLGVVGARADRLRQMARITQALTRRLPRHLAEVVVGEALSRGAEAAALTNAELQQREPYASRTLWDLVCALTSYARRLDIRRRLRLEQLAYQLVLGRFHIL